MAKSSAALPRTPRPYGKGRTVDLRALNEVREALGDASRRRDLLIEHLHAVQDRYGHLSAAHLVALAHEMKLAPTEVYEAATFYHHFDVVKDHEKAPPPLTVRVCDSVTCELFGARELITGLESALGDAVRVQPVPCVGRCEQAPVAVVGWNPIAHADVDRVKSAVESGAHDCPLPDTVIDYAQYAAGDGYTLYRACRDGGRDIEGIMAELEHAGLRGLGGAGFPAGRKWRILRDQPKPRLLAVNVDEGEPGTFKDRYYLERDPHRFLEGCLIAAWVAEIDDIYIYTRDEYPGVRALLARSVAELQERFDTLPDIHLRRGAGAYICGEESAMIESIEGKRGMPRLRPPYVAEVGLFGRPTLEHNAETLFWVREIVDKGGAWFAGHGRHGRIGLRSFSVSGRVKKPGVHLAPAGITVRELIDEYCGGMLDGHTFYGYFPGGASGGILPASLGDVPLDFDTLQEHGSFIGSAAVMVLSDHDRARDAALNAMRFFAHESCGQCTPCRVGSEKAAQLMSAKKWDQPLLEELAQVMEDASICGLGQAAPNPLRCVMKYFADELQN
ncbi:MAG: NAD(P)H-dependent oxidoreductase subunit E [Gammaproteobacteria bacterium]|nr:NAD(P)H-dependent oxidoreductase subunit E [Gammaproteobacteria bacterium]